MAITDRNIVIVPSRGTANPPVINFVGADIANSATVQMSVSNVGNVGTIVFSSTASSTILSIAGSTTTNGGIVTVNGTTDTLSATAGALVVSGGVGIAKNLMVGGSLTITNNLTVLGTFNATVNSTTNAANAYNVIIQDKSYDTQQYFPTMVVNNSGAQPIYDAAFNLSFYPNNAQLLVGSVNASSFAQVGALFAGQRGINSAIQLANTGTNAGGSITIGAGAAAGPQMQFYTYTGQIGAETASEKMRIHSNGYIGINQSSPAARLDIGGTTTSTSQAILTRFLGDNQFQLQAFTGQSAANVAGAETARFGVAYGQSNTTNFGAGFAFYRGGGAADGALSIITNATEAIRIDSAQKVGIGNSTPYSKLDVAYQNSFNATTPGTGPYGIYLSGQSTNDYATGITFSAGAATAGTAQAGIYSQGSGSYGTKLYFATTDSYATGAKTRMMIDSTGTVGINTINPYTAASMTGGLVVNGSGAAGTTQLVIQRAGSNALGINAGANTTGDVLMYDWAGGTWNINYNMAYGKLMVGSASTPQAKFSVLTTTGLGNTPTTWSTGYATVGPNVASQTGAALGLSYNTTSDQAEILGLAPGVAWKPLNLFSAGLIVSANSGVEVARFNSTGLGIGVTPAAKLHSQSANGTSQLYITGGLSGASNQGAGLYFSDSGDNSLNIKTMYSGGTGNVITVNPGNTEVIRFQQSGNVGVGNGNVPFSRLTVFKAGTSVFTSADNTSTAHLVLAGTDSLVRLQFGTMNAAPYAGWIQASYDNGGGANGVEPLLLNPMSGNVQIGVTADQGYKLYVNGTLKASTAVYTPIVYDSDNTAYYVDPASTSVINTLTASTIVGAPINYATSQGWIVSSAASQTGYFGGNFNTNGDGNLITWGVDPFGGRGLLWQTRNNDATSDADGGWDKVITGLNASKSYISIVYVRRVGTSANGTFYHGCDTSGQTLNLAGTANGNPYFSSFNIGTLPQDVWCVSIGLIQAYSDGNAVNTGVGGLYRMDTGQKISAYTDYKMASGATQQTHRTYLYYSTLAADSLDWWGPGFYEVNGNEPSIDSLVGNVNTGWTRNAYAPYYFDSANTSYYMQPSATSNINAMNMSGKLLVTGASIMGNIGTGAGTDFNDIYIGGASGWSSGESHGINTYYSGTTSPIIFSRLDTLYNGTTSVMRWKSFYYGGPQTSTIMQLAATSASTGDLTVFGNTYAKIYYDSANSSYFTQASSRSRFSTLDFGTAGYYIGAGSWGMRNTTPYGYIEFGPANVGHAHIYTDRSNFYFNVYDLYTNGRWVITEDYQQNGKYHGSGDGSIRAYIFYDNNDTTYFLDPNAVGSGKFAGYFGLGGNGYTDYMSGTFGHSIYHANYPSIGFNNQYRTTGMSRYWLMYLNANSHLALWNNLDGDFLRFYPGGYTQSTTSFRAPIFYDSDDTARYMDMNGNNTSQIGNLRINGDWGNAAGNASFTIRGNNPSIALRCVNGSQPVWLLHNDAGSTLYWYNQQGAVDGTSWGWVWNVNSAGTMIATGDIRAPLFYDYNNTAYYVDPASTSIMSYVQANNYMYSANAMYATIYYDTNNTAYYADYNGAYSINWQGVTNYSKMRIGLTGKYNTARNDYTGDSNYWTGTMGWGTTTFADMFTWGSGFTDSWSSPADQPAGTSHWETIQAMHYNNGSTGHGWQLTNGAGSPGLTYIRGCWGGGFTSWYKVAIYENNDQAARAFYASIYYDADNTGYYCNPAGTTPFNFLANGRVTLTADDSGFHAINAEGTGANVRLGSAWGRPGVYNGTYLMLGSENYIEFVTANVQRAYVDSGNNLISNGSVRGTIFYDQNNTGYYLDPNGSSNWLAQTTSVIYFQGVGGDSGVGNQGYAIYQVNGGWGYPYPDLGIGYHTGIRIGAYYGYNGTRFYNNNDWGTQIGSFGDGDNNLRSYYDIIAYASDRRLKENIRPIENAVAKVRTITGMVFDWKEMVRDLGFEPNAKTEVGVFAQDVEAVLPEAVTVAPFDYDWKKPGQSISGERYLTVKYEKLVPLLIQAIKEQQDQLDELRELIKGLTNANL